MKKPVLILLWVLLLALYGVRFWQTTGCVAFRGHYFNPLAVVIRVETDRKLDDQPAEQKVFHNKITATISELTNSYTQVIDPRFIIQLIGPLGLVLFVWALYIVLAKRSRLQLIHLVSIFVVSALALTSFRPEIVFYLLFGFLTSFTFWSLKPIAKSKKQVAIFLLLLLFTLWFFAINWRMDLVCNQMLYK